MSNLFLIDFNCELIHSIMRSQNISIHTIIVGTKKLKEELENKYEIQNVFTIEDIQEFYKKQNFILDYSLLLKYKHTQVKVENWFQRFTDDFNMTQYLYVTSLSFWNNYFKVNENIDCIISSIQEWGSNFDSIILDIAVNNNKKVFVIENTLVNGNSIKSQSILNYETKKYVKFDINEFDVINFNSFLHYKQSDKIFNNRISYKDILKQFPEKYGGYLLIMFFALLIGKYKSVHNSFNVSWWTYFKNYLYTKKMLKYYESLSIDINESNQFVFFALHMEPEATTLARTTFSNQLAIIKSISQALPIGWKLYVKEHPRQYTAFNNFKRYYFLAGVHKYRTKMFYDEIIKLPNVELINLNINSKELIEKSKAIITINGSIILESIVQNKPLILFSQNSTPFSTFEGIFDINNSDELNKAIEKIKDNYSPKYKDLELFINKFMYKVDTTKEFDYKKVFEGLVS